MCSFFFPAEKLEVVRRRRSRVRIWMHRSPKNLGSQSQKPIGFWLRPPQQQGKEDVGNCNNANYKINMLLFSCRLEKSRLRCLVRFRVFPVWKFTHQTLGIMYSAHQATRNDCKKQTSASTGERKHQRAQRRKIARDKRLALCIADEVVLEIIVVLPVALRAVIVDYFVVVEHWARYQLGSALLGSALDPVVLKNASQELQAAGRSHHLLCVSVCAALRAESVVSPLRRDIRPGLLHARRQWKTAKGRFYRKSRRYYEKLALAQRKVGFANEAQSSLCSRFLV
jgi:hypothetical protein